MILMSALDAKREIQTLNRRREQYMAIATGMSGFSETYVRSTNVHSNVENAAVKLVELCEKIDRKAEQYAKAITDAETLISSLERPKYREVLTLRYIEGYQWRKICEIMGYRDEKSAYRIHGWALAEAETKLQKAM